MNIAQSIGRIKRSNVAAVENNFANLASSEVVIGAASYTGTRADLILNL